MIIKSRKNIFAVLFLLYAVSAVSQDVDSLYMLYSQSKGERQISLANEITNTVYTLEYTDSLHTIDNTLNVKVIDAIVSNMMGDYAAHQNSDYQKSTIFYLKAAELYEQMQDTLSMLNMYHEASANYGITGDYENAIALMLKCYEIENQIGDKEELSSTLNNLGVMYSQWQQHETAITFFREAMEIERTLNRPLNYANRLASLAKEMLLMGDKKGALPLIKEALEIDNKLDEKVRDERIAVHLNLLGDIYYEMDSLHLAANCFKQGLEIFEKRGNQRMVAISLLSLGRLYVKDNKHQEASVALIRCIELCEQLNLKRSQRDAYKILYQAYKNNNQLTLALSALEQYITINDLLFNETTQQQFSEFQVKYDTQKKELELVRQQAEIDRHKLRLLIMMGGLFISVLLVVLLAYVVLLHIKRNKELKETNATKDKFFSIISHDLKNPAIAQRDTLQLLVDNAETCDKDLLTDYLRELLKSADGQVDLLYSLLHWAQVQTGRIPYFPTQFDLVAALRSDIGLIKNMAERKGILFEVQAPETVLVTGDDNMIITVVRNLLTNAVKFTSGGGKVTLDILPCKDGARPVVYTVAVVDTGTGMTQEQLHNLFRIDRQHSRKGTAGEQGSGLGLIVCKELIEKHGSRLQVESEVGKGSRFWFTV